MVLGSPDDPWERLAAIGPVYFLHPGDGMLGKLRYAAKQEKYEGDHFYANKEGEWTLAIAAEDTGCNV